MSIDVTVSAFKPLVAEVAQLREANAVEFDYADKHGNREARSHIHSLRRVKGDIERVRKAEKAAALEHGRRVDASAKALIGELDEMIAVHLEPLRQIEEREAARVEALQSRLAWLGEQCASTDPDGENWGSNYLASKLEEVRAVALDDSWQEFLAEAGQVKYAALAALEKHVATARRREAEAAELARLQEEAATRERAERERTEREAAQARERRAAEAAAEAARREAEAKAKAEREAHEKALREAEERAAKERAEAERRLREQQEAAERRELALKLETERKERERLAAAEAERAANEARERDQRHRGKIHSAIKAALISAGLSDSDATKTTKALASGQVPHVTVNY